MDALAVRRWGAHAVPAACLAIFLGVWTALAIAPRYRDDWLLENLLTFAAVPVVVLGYRRFRFSDRAYVQGTLFLLVHTLGAHYTYSEVPLGAWASQVLGGSRNHFDRLAHLAFGLLMVLAVRELLAWRVAGLGRAALGFLSLATIGACAAVYEIVEWLVAAVADPAAGQAFLGTQGDAWDAQKDMALALAGAALATWFEERRARRAAARRASGRDGGRSCYA